jgi:hypothetical protein
MLTTKRAMLLLSACLFSTSCLGCSRQLTFHVRGTVKDAATGVPIKGAEIALEFDPKHTVNTTPRLPIRTDSKGAFSFDVVMLDHAVGESKWLLKISRGKDDSEVIDITPEPTSNPSNHIFVVAHLKSTNQSDARP